MQKTICTRPKGRLILLVLWLGLGTLTGCQPPVGGPCTYEEQIGTALIDIDDQGIGGIFTPVRPWFPDTPVDWQGRPMDLTGLDHVRVGIHYPAHFKVIQKGSCVPVELELLSDETLMLTIALTLNEKGRKTEQSRQQIEQITATLMALTPDWPNCRLYLHGPGADVYLERMQKCLTDIGGDPERVQIARVPLPDNLSHPWVRGHQETTEAFFWLHP